jgi:hypothetical protein
MTQGTEQTTNGANMPTGTFSDDPFTVYDWEITMTVDGRTRSGAVGRTGAAERCRRWVCEELRRLPAPAVARAEVVRTSVINPERRRLVAVAERSANGTIEWTDLDSSPARQCRLDSDPDHAANSDDSASGSIGVQWSAAIHSI